MISKVKIKDFLGIKELVIDFAQKYITDKELSNQIINVNDQCISLVPMILAKNAAGKTSFIKAVSFALAFANKNSFMAQINSYSWKIILGVNDEIFRLLRPGDKQTQPIINMQAAVEKRVQSLIFQLHTELRRADTTFTKIDIELSDHKHVVIELDEHAFYVTLDNVKLNIKDMLVEIHNDISDWKQHPNNILKITHKNLLNDISGINFPDNVNSSAIFRDTHLITNLTELSHKHRTSKYINNLIRNFGHKPVQSLLKRLDSSIVKIDKDIEKNSWNIYVNQDDELNEYIPISPNNLSFGTQKTLEIIYKSIPLFKDGGIMMVDEIENGLHLSLIKLIVSLYEDEDLNVAGAQLLITTHIPQIAERNIVLTHNVYMYENGKFMPIKRIANQLLSDDKKENSHYAQIKFIKAKNYYNDLFWVNKNTEKKSTLSNIDINVIVNELSDGVKWVRAKR